MIRQLCTFGLICSGMIFEWGLTVNSKEYMLWGIGCAVLNYFSIEHELNKERKGLK